MLLRAALALLMGSQALATVHASSKVADLKKQILATNGRDTTATAKNFETISSSGSSSDSAQEADANGMVMGTSMFSYNENEAMIGMRVAKTGVHAPLPPSFIQRQEWFPVHDVKSPMAQEGFMQWKMIPQGIQFRNVRLYGVELV